MLAEETKPATVSFDNDENARRQIGYLVDRLSVRFGEHRVQRFVPQDTHIPEYAGVAVPAQDDEFTGHNWSLKRQPGDPPRRPLRLLEKPEEISSVLASVPDGPPSRFRWRQCLHDVVRAEGPERIAMEWWRDEAGNALMRDYFRVESREGLRVWVFRAWPQERELPVRWYLHGVFA